MNSLSTNPLGVQGARGCLPEPASVAVLREPAEARALEVWKEENLSDANVRLTLIVRSIRQLRDQIEGWIDDHGDGCPCVWCSGPFHQGSKNTSGDVMEHHLACFLWSTEHITSIIESDIIELDDDRLAAARERIAAEDGEPVPQLVGAS